ncbi:MAG: hypothetical protein OS112_00990 [Methanoregula sp.]|nr:MAG: hypothetical protein OS112_00990 [Methanoregula sp.]
MAQKVDTRQPYPRDSGSLLSSSTMYPKPTPLPIESLHTAIKSAFERALKTKKGKQKKIPDTPDKLVSLCLKHLKERTDPIIGTDFYTHLRAEEIFDMDAISHEMQRQRMQIGVFYQFLIIALMEASRQNGNIHIIRASDGTREGDVLADLKPPGCEVGLRLYMSVKKSADTVGGQDVEGVVKRLERVAKQEKNLTSPYLCVIAIATPQNGRIQSYDNSRSVKYNQDGYPYSENCEVWTPGFIYPFISGRSAIEIYSESMKFIDANMPFNSLKYREECNRLLKNKLIEMGISNSEGMVVKEKLFEYVAHED